MSYENGIEGVIPIHNSVLLSLYGNINNTKYYMYIVTSKVE